jgi:hypothetical protein
MRECLHGVRGRDRGVSRGSDKCTKIGAPKSASTWSSFRYHAPRARPLKVQEPIARRRSERARAGRKEYSEVEVRLLGSPPASHVVCVPGHQRPATVVGSGRANLLLRHDDILAVEGDQLIGVARPPQLSPD